MFLSWSALHSHVQYRKFKNSFSGMVGISGLKFFISFMQMKEKREGTLKNNYAFPIPFPNMKLICLFNTEIKTWHRDEN